MRVRVLTTITLLALLALAAPLSASLAQQADDPQGRLPLKLEAPELDHQLRSGDIESGRLAARSGRVRVLIELQAAPTARVYADRLEHGDKPKATADAKTAQAAIDRAQQTLVRELESARIGARVFGRMQRVFNGVHALVDRAKLGELARLPGVKTVRPTRKHQLDNSGGVPLVQAPQVWASAAAGNATGEGISIGIIDTGIDYIHTGFGGEGTQAIYDANDTTTINDGFFPSAKVVGGYDFVGDDYDAGADGAAALPTPDDDPMDCNGHGSHVAGTAGGYGVNADGSTYAGPWNTSTPFDSLRIGPGVAPEAELWALRVFGCGGSTDVTIQAIEFAVDPDRDGDFADHLDVINLSLGSDFGDPSDPDAVAINNAVDTGVIAALSAGNSADTFYITGNPGVAAKALSVASIQDALDTYDGFRVDAPASIAGPKPGSESAVFDWTGKPPVSGNLVYPPAQRSGCEAFTPANAGLLAGNIALLDWTKTPSGENECGSGTRVNNAANAGAIGVVLDYTEPELDIAISGSLRIPSIITPGSVGAELKAALAGSAVGVTLTPEYSDSVKLRNDAKVDSISDFSSRGPASRTSALKPDIAAPGQSIASVKVLSGNRSATLNGTSMAAPHVAGAMALLRQIHPGWSVEELKALVMNTASAPVRLDAAPASVRLGPQRAGSNRMTLADAIASQVVAYNADDAGQVSVSFGAVEVLGARTLVKNVRVANKGSAAASYAASYQPVVDAPGVSFSVAPAQFSVPPGGTANLAITLQATADQLPHSYDPSISLEQLGLPRHWLTEESGHALLTPTSGTTLRVPVYTAARAASDMHATTTTVATGGAAALNASIELAGTPVGSAQARSTPAATDEVSLLTAFELQHSSPNDGSDPNTDSADLQYVGVFSDFPAAKSIADPDGSGPASGTTLAFGVATYGDWSTPQRGTMIEVAILIDTNADGAADYELYNVDIARLQGDPDAVDVFVAALDNLNDPGAPITFQYLNGISASELNTVPYNTNVMLLPVAAADLGLTDASAGFSYTVETYHNLAEDIVDSSPKLAYNAAKPGLDLTAGQAGLPAYLDLPGAKLAVNYSKADFRAANSQGLLLLHHLNGSGKRVDVVRFQDSFQRMLPWVSIARQ